MSILLWPQPAKDRDSLVPASLFEEARLGKHVVPHTSYQARPEDWIVEKLLVPRETIRWSLNPQYLEHHWDGTVDPLSLILLSLAKGEDVGVESATGTGKSFLAACVIFWFLAAFKHALVNTYAPKEDQLRLYIWKEIGELWPRFQRLFPTAELTDLRIRMEGTDKWSAHGIATQLRANEESATKAQGAHAEHMLTVTEETPGIEPAIMKALRNTRTGEHNLQLSLGNPDDQQDPLHTFCVLPSTTHVIVSALDHPNVVTGTTVVPGAASPAGIRRIEAEDPPGTPMYESRVRGISPAEATDALIKLTWVHAAAARYPLALLKKGRRALGVDVANSEQGDKAAIAYWVGSTLEKIVSAQCPDANVLGKEVFDTANRLEIDAAHIGVDPVGVGAGTVNEMARLGMEPRRLGGSLRPISGAQRSPDGEKMDFVPDANKFDNLRAQMAWQLREDFRLNRIAIPTDPKLFRQLTAVQYKPVNGKIVLEKKEKTKERLGGSARYDEFDAIMYGNWVRPRTPDETTPRDAGDDRAPGFDYAAKTRKPRVSRALVPGEGDDTTRPDRYTVPRAGVWRMPRYGHDGLIVESLDDDEDAA